MKRLLFLTVVLLGFKEGFGQNSSWTFGVKAGAGRSGLMRTEVRDYEVRDEFKPGLNYGFGLRGGYRFSKYFTATVDLEWQHISDQRLRILDFNAVGVGRIVNKLTYDNKFQRVQVPVALQFSPFTKRLRPYVKVGIMPGYILNGSFDIMFTSTQNNSTDFDKLDADFKLPPNKKLQRQYDLFAGIGVVVGKHLSFEAVHYFAGKLDYAAGYSPYNMRLWPTYYSYALRGTQLSLVYHIW